MFIIITGHSSVLSKPGYSTRAGKTCSTRGRKTTNASKNNMQIIIVDIKLFIITGNLSVLNKPGSTRGGKATNASKNSNTN